MIGCEENHEDPVPGPLFPSVTPVSGTDLAANGIITLVFDIDPGNVLASVGTVSGTGKTRKISAPADGFAMGALALSVTWENGGAPGYMLYYTVVAVDETAPEVIASSPEDGAKGVDPTDVFEDGIEVTFSEPVTGDLMLMDGDDEVGWTSDEDVGWTSRADGNKIILIGSAGQELNNETEYQIAGTVRDLVGIKAEVSITFITK